MKKIYFILIILSVVVVLEQCKKNEPAANNTNSGCLVSAFSDTLSNVFVYLYDNNGRVITDSLPGGGNTTYFTYVGNTVSSINGNLENNVTLNSAGMPTSSTMDYVFAGPTNYQAVYNSDGTLNNITSETDTIVCNVVYSGGNIVSATMDGIPVSYQYYTNMPYTPYDPTAKIFALSGDWGYEFVSGNPGYFNPQPFSKNLLKYASAMNGGFDTRVNFTYQTDSKGAVTYYSRVDSAGNNYSAHFAYNNCP